MKIEFTEIKINTSGVPQQDKETKEWIISGRIFLNSDNVILKECPERKELSLILNNLDGRATYVLGNYDSLKKLFN
jgi:hypothetical protein